MTLLLDMTTVLAQAKPQGPGPFTFVGMMVFMFAFMYFFTIRPQKQKEKKHQEEIAKLKKGDNVMLDSGIYGEIHSVETDSMHVKIAEKTIIKIQQRSVRLIIRDEAVSTKEEK
jgi:preprotein translocase subunit YajC